MIENKLKREIAQIVSLKNDGDKLIADAEKLKKELVQEIIEGKKTTGDFIDDFVLVHYGVQAPHFAKEEFKKLYDSTEKYLGERIFSGKLNDKGTSFVRFSSGVLKSPLEFDIKTGILKFPVNNYVVYDSSPGERKENILPGPLNVKCYSINKNIEYSSFFIDYAAMTAIPLQTYIGNAKINHELEKIGLLKYYRKIISSKFK